MPQFHQMMGERLRSIEQGADTVVWLALSRAAARTRSGQFFQGEQHQTWQVLPLHIQRLFFQLFLHLFGWIQSSSPSSGITCCDRLFVLQIGGLCLPTCLWPGLTVLLKTSRFLWLNWKILPEPFGHNLTQSATDPQTIPVLNLSELWYKYVTNLASLSCSICLSNMLPNPTHYFKRHTSRTVHSSASAHLCVMSTCVKKMSLTGLKDNSNVFGPNLISCYWLHIKMCLFVIKKIKQG